MLKLLREMNQKAELEVIVPYVCGSLVTVPCAIALACLWGWLAWDFWKYKQGARTPDEDQS